MLNRALQKIFLTLYFYILCMVFSQSNQFYYHSKPNNVEIGNSIEISQLMLTNESIQSGTLYFRDKGGVSYQEIEMKYKNGRWTGIIPSHRITLDGIEYLTILHTINGGRIAMPLIDNPFDKPLSIRVNSTQFKDNSKRQNKNEKDNDYVEADVIILAPESRSVLSPDEVVISASLFNEPSIDQSQFQLLINDKDYTDQTVIFDDVMSLVPEQELEFGFYSIKLLLKTKYGMDVAPIEWSFSVSKGVKNFSDSFKYSGSLFGKKSYNTASSISINENEYNSKIDAEISWIKVRYFSRNSSRESKFLQPINRSSLIIQITDYLKIENGDVYPSISPFLLDGKRVRGRYIDAGFNYNIGFDGFRVFGKELLGFELKGGFELQTVSGLLTRSVQYQDGIDRAYELITDYTQYDNDGNRIYLFNRKGYTFPRNVNSTRFGMSINNNIKAGIHFLKAKDDFNEIERYASENSIFSVDTSITGDDATSYYTLTEFIDSIANNDSIKIKSKNWNDGTPQENLAIGFDFEGSLDNRKLLFQLGWNMSLTNYNIWAGAARGDSLDLLMDTISDGKLLGKYEISAIGDFIDSYSDIFTVNPLYMAPILPVDPIAMEESRFRAILNMPASAYYLRAKGSYMFNNILIEYRQLGPEYKSFGNPYLTNNIREFFINDRLSLLGRRLMFVMGYKHRDNKLTELVTNPITTKTISFNTTLVPGPGAPSFIFNFQTIGKTNGIDSIDVDQYGNFLRDNREDSQALNLMASINIPGNFNRFSTTSSININSITYSDNLVSKRNKNYFFQKAETQSFSASLSTRFEFPLKTTSTFNQTRIMIPFLDQDENAQIQENKWTSYIMSIQYAFLDNRLRLRVGNDYTTNGDNSSAINLYGGKLGCDWDIIDNLTLNFNSAIRFNNNNSNNIDQIDNDNDGIIDEKGENWYINSSGVNLTLGYKF